MARKLRRSIISLRLAPLSSLVWRYRSGDAVLNSAPTERWPSGRRRTPGKCVYGNVSRVRIPPSPPFLNCGKFNNLSKNLKNHILCGLRHCWEIKGIFMTTRATSSFLTALLISLAACEAYDVSPLVDEKIGTNFQSDLQSLGRIRVPARQNTLKS